MLAITSCIPLLAACAGRHSTSAPDPYPAPTIWLVSPLANTAVPLDRPVVVFRLGGVASTDSADARSFRVWVDGQDHSALFHIDAVQGAAEAWGPLIDASSAPGSSTAGSSFVGVHLVTAQLCTVRGVCSTVHTPVTVLPSSVAGGLAPQAMAGASAPPPAVGAAGPTTPLAVIPSEPQRNLIELLLLGLKKLWLH